MGVTARGPDSRSSRSGAAEGRGTLGEARTSGDPLAPHSLSPRELQELIAAERLGQPFFVFRDDAGHLRLFSADHSKQVHTVGRRSEADLSIAWDPEVSSLHAELQRLGGEWTVVDDGLSTNGTFVNGERVGGRQRLRDGDRLRVGQTVLAYKAGPAGRVKKTEAAGESPFPRELTETQRRVLIALCRPFRERTDFTTPATNQQIADELFLSVHAVKMHLRALFTKFELSDLPQNEKRARLAESVLRLGVITVHDLG